MTKNETIVKIFANEDRTPADELFTGTFVEFTQISLGANGYKQGIIVMAQESDTTSSLVVADVEHVLVIHE